MSTKEIIEKVVQRTVHGKKSSPQPISEKDNRAILAAEEADLKRKSYVSIMHH